MSISNNEGTYNERIKRYIKKYRDSIKEIGEALGVMPEAIAGVIAEEHEY